MNVKKMISVFVMFVLMLNFSVTTYSEEETLPEQWDSRDYGWVTSVKNQSDGICWAYAICAAAETDIIRQGYETDIDLSEGYLYAIHNLYTKDRNNEAADADTPEMALKISQTYNALAYESDYPYSLVNSYGKQDIEINPCKYTISSFGDVPVSEAKQWIMDHGSLICGICMTNEKENAYVNSYVNMTENHIMLIVGWNDYVSSSNFINQPEHDGAWLCKNSWGEEAGESGYFWVSYEDATISELFGLTTTKTEVVKKIGNYSLNSFGMASVTMSGGSANQFGCGKSFFVSAGTGIDSFDVILNANDDYSYKVYCLADKPSKSSIQKGKIIKSGQAKVDFGDYGLLHIPINYTTSSGCYIYIEISAPKDAVMRIGASSDKTDDSYSTQYQNGVISSVATSNNSYRINLNKLRYRTKPVVTPETTVDSTDNSNTTTKTLNNQTTTTTSKAEQQEHAIKSLFKGTEFALVFTAVFAIVISTAAIAVSIKEKRRDLK